LASKKFSTFKIKLSGDTSHDFALVKEIYENFKKTTHSFYADANQSYDNLENLNDLCNCLKDNNFKFLEQPVNKNETSLLNNLSKNLPIPIYADEGFRLNNPDYKNFIHGNVSGLVFKLVKFGGFYNSIKILKQVPETKIISISCMGELENSILYSKVIINLFPQIKIIDLDSHLKINETELSPFV
jgi:L-alanine-DL-glutamate epimerase-like enolase superfamily enzyme